MNRHYRDRLTRDAIARAEGARVAEELEEAGIDPGTARFLGHRHWELGRYRRVVSLCDVTGAMVQPWAEAGYVCDIVDPQHREAGTEHFRGGGMIRRLACRVETLPPDFCKGAEMVFAFPPCTDLAASGARWWKAKGPEALSAALTLVNACRAQCEQGHAWMVENPVGRLSTHWRKPDETFNPCDFERWVRPGDDPLFPQDAYTKRTCLWVGGTWATPMRATVEPVHGSAMWKNYGGRSQRTKNARSKTPIGFARAVFHANGRHWKEAH